MARKTTENQTTERSNKLIPFASSYEVSNPHWLKDNSMCFFSLVLHTGNGDLVLHGLRLLYDKKDKKPFLSPASYKGNDGHYYSHYYLPMEDSMAKAIIEELENL